MKEWIEEWRSWPWPTRFLMPVWMLAGILMLGILPFGLWKTTFANVLVYTYIGAFFLNMFLCLFVE